MNYQEFVAGWEMIVRAWQDITFSLRVAFAWLPDDDRETVKRLLFILNRTKKERTKKKLRRRIMRIVLGR